VHKPSFCQFRQGKVTIKLHTLMDLRGSIPMLIFVTHGKIHEVNSLDDLFMDPGAIYIMDRGYLNFGRLYNTHQAKAFFLIRAEGNFRSRSIFSQPFDKAPGIQAAQVVQLYAFYSRKAYPDRLRRIPYYHAEKKKSLIFLDNLFSLSAFMIPELFRCRWKIELFFKWIKQHLRIKAFYGTSENAVKTQIWIAIRAYVLVAIAKKKLKMMASLYTMLQILIVSLFKKTPLFRLISQINLEEKRLILLTS
jgi:transposase